RTASSSWTAARSSRMRRRTPSSAARAATARKNSCRRFSRIEIRRSRTAPVGGGAPPGSRDLNQIAYVNGEFVPLADAKVSVLDRGFLFADGIYEVSAVLDGRLVDNASHLARLERSVGEIKLKLPETVERITELQKELIAHNKLENGMVYLEVTRGAD